MLTALYARYSSSLQKTTSIDDQLRVCREAAARFGCTVDERHIYADKEISGAVADRPEYQRLMKAAKRREFGAVIAEAQDRLWRDEAEMHSALKVLAFHGIKVFSVAAGADLTDRTGRVLATVMGLKDAAFLEDLRDKTRRGMSSAIGRKMSAGGAPYGYRSAPIHETGKNDAYGQPIAQGYRKVVHETEAAVVRRIFEQYAEGASPKTICHRLNAEHIPPPRAKSGRPFRGGWTWTTIAGSAKKQNGILNNPLYIGRLVWNRTQKMRDPENPRKRVTRPRPASEWQTAEDQSLRIVSDKLWKRVRARQARATSESRGRPGGPRPKYLFSGLLICAECGGHYVVRNKRYYECGTHLDRGKTICANGRLAPREVTEAALLDVIQRDVLSPYNMSALVKRVETALVRNATRSRGERRAQDAELRKAQAESENIKEAIRHGRATATLLEMLEETETSIQRLSAEMDAVPKPQAVVRTLPTLIERYAGDFRAALRRDNDCARELLRHLLGPIVLRPEESGLYAEVRGSLVAVLGDMSDNWCRGRESNPQGVSPNGF
jgi:site-specific DNA recombinase